MKKIGITALTAIFLALLVFIIKPEGYFFKKENIGKVLAVDNSDAIVQGVSKVGCQHLKIKILTGEFKGTEIEANNLLSGSMEYDEFYEPEDKILMAVSFNEETEKVTETSAQTEVLPTTGDKASHAGLLGLGMLLTLFGLSGKHKAKEKY